ncbi:GGDEF domain-containing protein [Desulfovibrio desulfuricans]|uniref:GGDEF domain-containing protein n=1 Tax=Desulfovibrio desulfuricans TaxID=876 RepID=UPI003983FAAA
MSITAFFRTLASRSHWAIHSVWLVVLAVVLCANVVDDYFLLQKNDLRLLLSESSIAVNIVKMELGGITHLLDTVESTVIATWNDDQLADQLQGLMRDNPFVAAIAVELNGVPRASTGAIPSASTAVFSRSTARDGIPSVSVSIALKPEFWGYKLAYAFNRADAKVAVYTASGRPLLPFANLDNTENAFLAETIANMAPDAAALHTQPLRADGARSMLTLQQAAAPFLEGGPLVVGTIISGENSYAHWHSDLLTQVLIWLAAAVLSTSLLLVEAGRRRLSELSTEKLQSAMRSRDKFISILMDHAPIMVSYWDAERRCHYANRMYRAWFGKSEEEIIGIDVQSLLGEELLARCAPLIDATLRGEPQDFEQERARADGSTGYVLSRYIPDMDGREVRGFFVIASDITELKQTQQNLEKRIEDLYSLATTDALTGLNNRRNLLEKIQFEIERAKRYGLSMVFFMLDIDHFKKINDTYGHDTGDAVLKGLGALLHDTMRTSDHVGRLGGEEFGILLASVVPPQAEVIAERLRRRVEEMVVWHSEKEIRFTVSIGLADLQTDVENPLENMMKRADLALYRAKNGGRNRVCLAENLLPPGAENSEGQGFGV